MSAGRGSGGSSETPVHGLDLRRHALGVLHELPPGVHRYGPSLALEPTLAGQIAIELLRRVVPRIAIDLDGQLDGRVGEVEAVLPRVAHTTSARGTGSR